MRRHGVWLVVLVACFGACDGGDLVADAGVEVMPERPADAVIDRPADLIPADIALEVRDVPVELENARDQQGAGDCPVNRCGNQAWFIVPDFFRRFGAEAYDVEVTACRADFCAAARVQTYPNSRNTVTERDAGVDGGSVLAPGYSADLHVFLLLTATPMVRARSDDVMFRVVTTSSGRLLIDHRARLPVDVYCPGGLHCGVCEQITVEIDGADGGRPIDAHSPPAPDEVCE